MLDEPDFVKSGLDIWISYVEKREYKGKKYSLKLRFDNKVAWYCKGDPIILINNCVCVFMSTSLFISTSVDCGATLNKT